MTTPIVQILAAVAVGILATVAGITDHLSGDALVGIYAAALGYIFGVAGGIPQYLNNKGKRAANGGQKE